MPVGTPTVQGPAETAPGNSPQPPAKAPGLGFPPPPQVFGPTQLRLPALPPTPNSLGSTPVVTPEVQKKLEQYVNRFVDPEATLDLIQGKTRLLIFKTTPKRIQIANDEIAESSQAMGRNQNELLLLGKQVGETVMTFWFPDPQDQAKEITLTYLIRVFPDPQAKERLERTYKALEKEINEFLSL
jgi:pilus assembly protein CpaC